MSLDPHGGNIYAYDGVKLDFSVNLNPLGMPEEILQAVRDHGLEYDRYPDPNCRALRRALAAREGVPEEWLVFGNGAADLIVRLAMAVKPRQALVPAPTFSEYEAAVKLAGGETRRFFLDGSRGYRVTADYAGAVRPGDEMVFLCNPNNPTGRLIPLPLLEQILQYCAAQGARLFLDECFLDLTEDGVSAKSLLAAHPELLILKAFTKSYGMAGIRLGYCLCADNALLCRMAAASPPWNVSTPAQSAGVAALAERDFLQRTLSLVRTERRWLTDNLTALGFWVCPSHANYLLFRGPLGLREGLLQQGIAIRGCGNYNGLGDGWYRIAVRPHGENEALITAIRQFCKEKSLWQ